MSQAVPTVNVDSVTAITPIIPAGRYKAQLLTAEGALSKEKNPMIIATFVVTDNSEQEGMEAKIWYPLVVSEKNGRKYGGGIIDVKRTFAAIGKPMAANAPFPAILKDSGVDEETKNKVAHTAAALYLKTLKGVQVQIQVTEEVDRVDASKKRTRTQVVGRAVTPQAAPAADDQYVFDDTE